MNTSKSDIALFLALTCALVLLSLAMRAQAQEVTFLTEFRNAQESSQALMQATDGNFYGTTGTGGDARQGEVFRMTPSGDLTSIYSFCLQRGCPDGQAPAARLTLGNDGNLYGVTTGGAGHGSTISGTIFKITLDGQLTTLHSFCALPCNEGVSPTGLTLASDGNFYGTTTVGGKNNEGTIFRISPAGKFDLLYTFCSQHSPTATCTDGEFTFVTPIQGSDGNFYGTASGGTHNAGMIYELSTAGTYTVLYNFCSVPGCADGGGPSALVQDADGNFFGVADGGGSKGYGTVFELTSAHEYVVLHNFDLVHGDHPLFGLTLANDGNLYGTATDDGFNGNGTLFEITPTGVFTPLYTFNYPMGYDPWGWLVQGTNGILYGTTLYGPPPCCYGTIFSVTNGISPSVQTVPVAGRVGQSVIILGNGLTGSSRVTFNGTAAQFTVESDSYIKATVPNGATTGTVSVMTASGTLNSNPQFVVAK
jgi:uncharacterized repeat protein (TIGR03803 family)